MRVLLSLVASVLLAGCTSGSQTPHGAKNCGLLGCISSPYLQAKLSPAIIGQPVSSAIQLAGTPTSSYTEADGVQYLTWRREQLYDGSLLACTETVTVRDSRVTDYRFDGHC